jgi:hypothetical protein
LNRNSTFAHILTEGPIVDLSVGISHIRKYQVEKASSNALLAAQDNRVVERVFDSSLLEFFNQFTLVFDGLVCIQHCGERETCAHGDTALQKHLVEARVKNWDLILFNVCKVKHLTLVQFEVIITLQRIFARRLVRSFFGVKWSSIFNPFLNGAVKHTHLQTEHREDPRGTTHSKHVSSVIKNNMVLPANI